MNLTQPDHTRHNEPVPPALEFLQMRDGAKIAVRRIKPEAPQCLVIHIHGSSFNSLRYLNFGRHLARQQCEVLLMDLRGNGESAGRRGDVDYVGQLEDDLADLLAQVTQRQPHLPVILCGHSAGSMVILRYLNRYSAAGIASYIVISPTIASCPETSRYDFEFSRYLFRITYWRKKPRFTQAPSSHLKHLPQLTFLKYMLCKVVPALRSMTTLVFPADPKLAQAENRVLTYSYNMMASLSARNYRDMFARLRIPVLLIIGGADEATETATVEAIYHWHLHPEIDKQLHVIAKANHLSVVPQSVGLVSSWIQDTIGKLNRRQQRGIA